MKRVVAGVVLAAVLLLVSGVGATAADGPTMAQFRRLRREVARIENRVTQLEQAPPGSTECLSTIPVSQFNDYEQYFDTGPITGLDLDSPTVNQWDVLVWTCSTLPVAKALVPSPEH